MSSDDDAPLCNLAAVVIGVMWFIGLAFAGSQLVRIADALDRAYPKPVAAESGK